MSKYECKICNQEKQLSHFSKNKGICKTCNNLYESNRRKTDLPFKFKQQHREYLRVCFNPVNMSEATKSKGARLLGFLDQEDLKESLLKTSFTGSRDGMQQDHFRCFNSVSKLKIHTDYKIMAMNQIAKKENLHYLSAHLNSKKGTKSPQEWIMTLTQAIRRPDSIIGKELLNNGASNLDELTFELGKSKRMIKQIKSIDHKIALILETEMKFKDATIMNYEITGLTPPPFATERERRFEQQELVF